MPIIVRRPAVRVRSPRDDELYVMMVFERHASHCARCEDPLHAYRVGRSLCPRGMQRAVDVTSYLCNRHGDTYSVAGFESPRRTGIKIHRDYAAVRGLLVAVERGMQLCQKQTMPRPTVHHYYDRTFAVPRQRSSVSLLPSSSSDEQTSRRQYVRVIERNPRDIQNNRCRVSVYQVCRRGRGSLCISDMADRAKRDGTYLRVHSPIRYYRH